MSFDGTEGAQITLGDAGNLTKEYRDNNSGTKGAFIGSDEINAILGQTGCKGIRVYFTQSSTGVKSIVMVGADADENDLTDYVVGEAIKCPTCCGRSNKLNSD
ncbi:MAG TPA: hypothetical protein PLI97_02950 [Fluviicola sp.]|nr:hypothetical protein [Fluviicola sp.]